MSIVICLTLLLAWTSQCATLSLTASTNTLSRSGTSNFTLTCTIDDHGNNSTSDGGLDEIYRMRIAKRGNNRWNTVVEMSPEWKDPKVADDSDGQLTAESGQTYLKVTWAMASYDIVGRYICDILGYSWSGEIVSQRTPSVYIDSEGPLSLFELFSMTQKALRSMNENKDRIKTIASSREIDQRKLETSFKTNKEMLSDIMENKDLIQKINSTQETFQQKLEASYKQSIEKINSTQEMFQQKLEASYKQSIEKINSTQEMFQQKLEASYKQSIEKMNSTQETFQTKLEASNKTTQKMLREIIENKDLIFKMNSTQETLQKNLEAFNKTHKKMLSDVMKNKQSISKMNSSHEIILEQSRNTNITLKSLLQDMSILKLEISNDTNEKDLEDDIARNKERIVKMNYSQETVKNKLDNLIQANRKFHGWPQGTYALIEPETGCPADTGVQWKLGYRRQNTMPLKNKDHVSTLAHMKKPVLETERGLNFVTQHHCSVVEPSSARAWPAGSYCVMKYRNLTCPVGFQEGLIIYDEHTTSDGSVSGYHVLILTKFDSYIRYCCRNDSLPNEAIHLPTTKPFYLHRYGGTCQKVQDMQVTEEFIFLDTENNESKFVDYAPDGAASLPDVKLQLCYYKPS